MTETDEAIFIGRIQSYLDVNAYSAVQLRDNLHQPGNKQFARQFRNHLEKLLSDDSLSAESFQRYTGISFESERDFKTYLKELFEFIFNGGIEPKLSPN